MVDGRAPGNPGLAGLGVLSIMRKESSFFSYSDLAGFCSINKAESLALNICPSSPAVSCWRGFLLQLITVTI